jgi:transcriptional regulator with XRE-family HTH domain
MMPEIPEIGGLHRMIMLELLKKRSLLCGEEIRFLRKMARITAKELAGLMGLTPTQISRVENGKRKIGSQSDRVLRLTCYAGLLERILKARDAGFTEAMASTAKEIPSLDIRDVLRKIEAKSKGPKSMRIDPTVLAHSSWSDGPTTDPIQ